MADGGNRVLDRGRERMLGREAVVHRQHAHTGVLREEAARLVVRVEVSDDPSATVQVNEQRRRGGKARAGVETRGHRPTGAGNVEFVDLADGNRGAGIERRLPPDLGPRLGHRKVLEGGPARQLQQPERELDLGLHLLSVDADRSRSGDELLRPRRQSAQASHQEALEPVAVWDSQAAHLHKPMRLLSLGSSSPEKRSPSMAYTVPDLPYDYNALEPHVDEATMRVHHDKHHQAYVDKANAALEGTEWADKPVEEVLKNLDKLGDKATPVRNNGGGHYNHSLFWEWMSPDGGGEPDGDLASAIDSAFGSFVELQGRVQDRRRQPVRLRLVVARPRRQRARGRLDAPTRTTRSPTARRRCSASTCGSTPTT